ncbi:MAG TPA: hemolysin activation protein [Gallicola sp.]|nr:hemolysin activation protein [Gallicola sp.]
MNKSIIDVPVALIFFNRPAQFKKVFEIVSRVKPSKLFLIQDGARLGNGNDMKRIDECRQIVEAIDWECEVHKNYSTDNLGCGKRVYTGITWAFEHVDRLIILEDDCVPSMSFFPFCTELLEKYVDDPRVGMISGMNHLNSFDKIPYDYTFARVGSIAGWATWKRSWETIEYNFSFLEEENTIRLLENFLKHNKISTKLLENALKKKAKIDNGEKLSSWSYQRGFNDYLHSALIIVPKFNLMTNIGLTEDSVHSVNDIRKVPIGLRKIYKLELFEMNTPLKHPKYIIEDYEYNKLVNKIMKPKGLIKYTRRIESIVYRLVLGDGLIMLKKLFRR